MSVCVCECMWRCGCGNAAAIIESFGYASLQHERCKQRAALHATTKQIISYFKRKNPKQFVAAAFVGGKNILQVPTTAYCCCYTLENGQEKV